eukprot:Skav224868  [mRNA]  locus=scaffold1112:68935:69894:+ [translate_table: standard]
MEEQPSDSEAKSAQSRKPPDVAQVSAVGDSTIRSLARQLKELHGSGDVNFRCEEKTFRCNSLVVATWSSKFRSLLQEGHDTGCRTIEVKGSVEVVEDAMAFMKDGNCRFAVMDLNQRHPLLEFASEYGLDDLKVTYGEAMMCKDPVTLQNAASYLELGLRFSVVNLSLVAANLLAANVGKLPQLNETVLALDGQCLKAVLASDALSIEDEQDAIGIIRSWVDRDAGQRSSNLDTLLSQVRLSLCSYQALIDLMSNLGDNLWKGVDEEELRGRVRQVIDEKLQGNLSDRRRRCTKLPGGETETRLATTLKVSKGLYAESS